MAKTKLTSKFLTIPVASMRLDREHNIRDPKADLDIAPLKADILLAGRVKNRPIVHFKGDTFDRVIQGNRRVTSVQQLREEFPNDNRWKTLDVEVYTDLSEADLIDLMIDSGNTKGLTRAEVFRAVWMYLDQHQDATRDQLAVKFHSLLGIHFPSGSNKTGEEIAKHYTGTVQNIVNGWRLPFVAQNAFMAKEKGEQKWPTKTQVATLAKIFEDERAKDVTARLTKAEPGPLFLAKWKEVVDAASQATGDGSTREKTVSAFSRAEQEAKASNAQSLIVRLVFKCTTRAVTSADKRLAKLDVYFATTVEPLLTDAMKDAMALIMTEDIASDVPTPV